MYQASYSANAARFPRDANKSYPGSAKAGMSTADPTHVALSAYMVTCGGAFLLSIIISLPLYDAYKLTHHFNYVYWNGKEVLYATIIAVTLIPFLWVMLCRCVFQGPRLHLWKTSDVSLMAASGACMVGVVLLMIASLASHSSYSSQMALSQTCEVTIHTRGARTWYTEALTMRRTAECASVISIEDCSGFENLAARVDEWMYFKTLEQTFACTGFCHEPLARLDEVGSGDKKEDKKDDKKEESKDDEKDKKFLLQVEEVDSSGRSVPQGRKRPHNFMASLLSRDAKASMPRTNVIQEPNVTYPPTLFSNLNFEKISCQRAAAVNLENVGHTLTDQLWWQGIALIGLAILIGFADALQSLKLQPEWWKQKAGKYKWLNICIETMKS